jgi:ABC-type phosphate/phosphonate transport system permease subunit
MDDNELFTKYLEMIQNVIERLARNSFQIKAWTATIFTATIVLTYSIINTLIFIVLIAVISLFWALDSYYLKQERLFRKLYEQKVNQFNDVLEKDKIEMFDMNVSIFQVSSVFKTMFSISELLYYIAIIGTLVAFLITYLTVNWKILIQ